MVLMRILIVDDSKVMRSAVTRAMRDTGINFTVVEASDGKVALEMVRRERPDVVLCDWNMPVMSGIELVRELRARGDKVVFGMVSARSTLGSSEEALAAGADFFIAKPFASTDFKTALEGRV